MYCNREQLESAQISIEVQGYRLEPAFPTRLLVNID